jgi:hypothetical protein
MPLPTAGNLAAAIFHAARQDNELSAPWRRAGDKAFWLSRSAWSLLAIAQWRQRLTGQPFISVWLPDFFCNASLIPLRNMRVQLQFYPLTDQMAPDLDACRTLAEESRPDLFVLVHFFGQPVTTDGAKRICIDKGAWLIEDAAHVLRPIPGIGECGDCVLYSPHKHLPIPDGAVLVVSGNGPAKLGTSEIALEIFTDVYQLLINTSGFSHKPAMIWLIKRILQGLGVRSRKKFDHSFYLDNNIIKQELAHPKISPLAKHLLSSMLNSLDNVAHLRRQNGSVWESLLLKDNLILSTVYSGNFTPYLAGFALHDEASAEKLYLQWQHAGLPVTTWPDLPPEVLAEKERHHNALMLRKTRIYLPVHQSLNHGLIAGCVRSL